MAEFMAEAVKSSDVKIELKPIFGGEFLFHISAHNVEVVKELCNVAKDVCETAVTLGAFYVTYQMLIPVIDDAVKRAFGGTRDDQDVKDIKPGSMQVVLHCFTNDRFLEVLTDYENGEVEKRLQEGFSQVGIKVKGLKVEIKNMAKVKEIKEAIHKRYHRCLMKNLTRAAHVSCFKFQQDLYSKDNIETALLTRK